MNKETRSFVWGIFLVLVCGTGTGINISNLRNGMHYNVLDWVLFAFCLMAAISGAIRIYKAIN